jgi:hypothetical protein
MVMLIRGDHPSTAEAIPYSNHGMELLTSHNPNQAPVVAGAMMSLGVAGFMGSRRRL